MGGHQYNASTSGVPYASLRLGTIDLRLPVPVIASASQLFKPDDINAAL